MFDWMKRRLFVEPLSEDAEIRNSSTDKLDRGAGFTVEMAIDNARKAGLNRAERLEAAKEWAVEYALGQIKHKSKSGLTDYRYWPSSKPEFNSEGNREIDSAVISGLRLRGFVVSATNKPIGSLSYVVSWEDK